MNPIEIPTLLFWENGNTWYGSCGQARFFIQPETPEGEDAPRLSVQLWRGPMCMELSQILDRADFPVSSEGLTQTVEWLEEQSRRINDSAPV